MSVRITFHIVVLSVWFVRYVEHAGMGVRKLRQCHDKVECFVWRYLLNVARFYVYLMLIQSFYPLTYWWEVFLIDALFVACVKSVSVRKLRYEISSVFQLITRFKLAATESLNIGSIKRSSTTVPILKWRYGLTMIEILTNIASSSVVRGWRS